MPPTTGLRSTDTSATTLLLALAAVKLLLHLLTIGGYGYFRDEFYYLACSDHLAAGYVDHPPLSIFLLAAARGLMGDSLLAIRLLPALAGAGLVLLTGFTARELGGGRFAQGLAATAVIVAPLYLAIDNFFSMNAFEPLFWTAAAYVVIRIIKTGNARLWVWFGVIVGLGLENKHSMLFFGFGVCVALLLTPHRRFLADRWLWLGGLVAGLLFLPNLVWEATHSWATVEFMRNAQAYKNTSISPAEFMAQQLLMLHPLVAPIWLAGLAYYLLARAGRQYQILGWTYVIILLVFLVEGAKVYYLGPIYPMLLAGGGVAVEAFVRWTRRGWLKPAFVSLLLLGGALLAPMALPLLPIEAFIRYQDALGLAEASKRAPSERQQLGELPQYFADMHGWSEVVATVAAAYNSLSPDERAKAAVYVQNYGEAGAVDFLGAAYHLPKAISGHNNYWLWGPREYSGEIVVVLGSSRQELEEQFETVEPAGEVHCGYCMPFENNQRVYICRGLKRPLRELWPRLKRFV